MYTDEANEIYLKVCEKYKREPLDTMHTRTMLFECINIALKQGQLLPIDSVVVSFYCGAEHNGGSLCETQCLGCDGFDRECNN
jgi:hypothetical protein